MEGEAGPVHVDYSCSIDTRYWFTYSPFNQSTNVYQTHFCWGNLTIGWHPDDDVPCSRLRDSGESEKSFKNKKTRGGWGETDLFSLCSFNTSPLYYLRAWHRLTTTRKRKRQKFNWRCLTLHNSCSISVEFFWS